MKWIRIVAFVGLSALFVRSGFSQSYWQYADQTFNLYASSIQQHALKIYLISNYIDEHYLSGGFFVHAFDLNGNLKRKTKYQLGEYVKTSKALISNDGKLIVVGYYTPNCHLGGQDKGFWMKLDTNGVVLDSTVFSSAGSANVNFIDAVQLANGDYGMASQTGLYVLDAGLNTYTSTSISGNINSLGISQSGNLLVNRSQSASGPHETLELDSQFNILQTFTTSFALQSLNFNNGFYYALTAQRVLERRSQNFQLLNTSSNAQNFAGGFLVNHFSLDHDTLYAVGQHQTNSTPFYLRLDTNLQLISMKTAPVEFKNPVGILKMDEQCYTAHACNVTNIPILLHTGIQSFGIDSVFNFTHDLELKSVQAYSVNLVYFSPSAGVYFSYKIKALVKNSGSTPISAFVLNARLNDGLGHCTKKLLQEHVEGILLQPGDSMMVLPDTVIVDYTNNYTPAQFFLNRIFSISAPNHEMDGKFSNDTKTLSLAVPFQYTSLKEELKQEDVQVFPNPSDQSLKLTCKQSLQGEINRILVYDQLGIQVKSIDLIFVDGMAEFSTADIASGVYLLQINHDSKPLASKRFVVTH